MRLPLLTAAALFLWCSPAFAHRLHVEARVTENYQLRVEAYYDDDTPAQDARITISRGDQLIAQGLTDDKGVRTFPCPSPGTYTVRAQSAGHADTATLVVPQPAQAAKTSPPPPEDDRASRTRTPWARLAAGLAIIGGLWLAWRVTRRSSANVD